MYARTTRRSGAEERSDDLAQQFTGPLQVENAAELHEGLAMVIHADVDHPVVKGSADPGGDDQDRTGLHAASVTARRLGRIERIHEALGERSGRGPERRDHRVNHLGPGENVALGTVVDTAVMTGPRIRALTRPGSRPTIDVDDRILPSIPSLVTPDELLERFFRRVATLDQLDTQG